MSRDLIVGRWGADPVPPSHRDELTRVGAGEVTPDLTTTLHHLKSLWAQLATGPTSAAPAQESAAARPERTAAAV